MKFFSKIAVLGALFLSACGSELVEENPQFASNEAALSSGDADVALDPVWGAHFSHWNQYQCATCHDFSLLTEGGDFAQTLKFQNPSPGYAFDPSLPAPSYDAATKTCSNVQCHTTFGTYNYQVYDWGSDDGSFIAQSVKYADAGKPNWFKKMDCNGCHSPTGSRYSWHGNHGGTISPGAGLCQTCHPTVTQSPTTKVVTFVDPNANIRHFTGTVELAPKYKANCFNCH